MVGVARPKAVGVVAVSRKEAGVPPKAVGVADHVLHRVQVGVVWAVPVCLAQRSTPVELRAVAARADLKRAARVDLRRVARADLKRVARADLKRAARADLKRVAQADLKRVAQADLKRAARVDHSVAQADLKRVAQVDLKRVARVDHSVAQADLKRAARVDLKRAARVDHSVAQADLYRVVNSPLSHQMRSAKVSLVLPNVAWAICRWIHSSQNPVLPVSKTLPIKLLRASLAPGKRQRAMQLIKRKRPMINCGRITILLSIVLPKPIMTP